MNSFTFWSIFIALWIALIAWAWISLVEPPFGYKTHKGFYEGRVGE
jgi:hypothetical protein